MRTFIAVSKDASNQGQLLSCITWGQKQISDNNQDLVRILRFRMGEQSGRLVAEITDEGTRLIEGHVIVSADVSKRHA
jgi:hypothetical protein